MSKKQKMITIVIIVIFISIIIFQNRKSFFDSQYDASIDKKRVEQKAKAEQPLKEFNENIYSKIAFTGTIVKNNYSCTPSDDKGGSYWMDIKIDKPIIKPNSIPLKILTVYDFTKNPIKIYYHIDNKCSLDDENIGDKVEKRLNETFIRIYPKRNTTTCTTISYTTDFDYFQK